MANFDPTKWYHLYVNENKENAFIGSNLFAANNTAGTTFFQSANTTMGRQRWQLYAVNETYYVMRTREGGPDAYLGAAFSQDETTPGQTRAHMIRGNVSDDSIFWKVTPWGDGTFFLTNKANGTRWHLGRKSGDVKVAMDSNFTKPQNGQRWSFNAITDIQTKGYGTVNLPTETVSAPSSIKTSDSDTPSDSSNPGSSSGSSSSGLSSGAKAAIGGSIGGVALIALVVLGLFFWRRSKRKQVPIHERMAEAPPSAINEPVPASEAPHDGAVKYEMAETPYAELPPNERAVELPSSPVVR